ncbi:hypothetical protein [Streptomyces sp. XC 2026]|uniref:hypothetical protein n=1 Tax=Streptomyces sp. XC 2026 TaxID=2782004 RepID=UPI00190651D1|nr:hypothetical protein [Streptomyces sp. XC 2026]QQN79770.1 hypothetical protein IPZ77_21835 [Streptomyces sp. XC 2026]QQN80622.1 hypothetical protein IPZ77_26820 [Streptomyces sp. XC 2026]
MTDTPYTRADLITEAARQHHELTQEQNFVDTGERMEGAPIASAEDATWDALDDRHYDTAMREIESLIEGSADTSPWAVGLGDDGLVPSEQAITLGPLDDPRVRIHFAFAEDYPAIDQADLIAQFRAFIATDLT